MTHCEYQSVKKGGKVKKKRCPKGSRRDKKSGYFFTKGLAQKPISKNTFSKRIPVIFKKYGVGTPPTIQMLRHIYLMNKYGTIKEDMKDDSYMMGHSSETQKNYILKK